MRGADSSWRLGYLPAITLYILGGDNYRCLIIDYVKILNYPIEPFRIWKI